MNNRLIETVGIDTKIQRLQDTLYSDLNDTGAINGFGRVYKNIKGSGVVLEHHDENNEYQDVLRSDDSRFFFIVGDNIPFESDPRARVDIVFMVDLSTFYPNSEIRKDEQFRLKCLQTVRESQFEIKGVQLGSKYLNNMVNGYGSDVNFKMDDLHPYHIFTVQTEINYNINTCN